MKPQHVTNAVALVLLIGVLFGMTAEYGGGCGIKPSATAPGRPG